MTDHLSLQPWDDAVMTRDLLALVLELPRVRLSELRDAPTVPAAYLVFFATTSVEPTLDPLVSTGQYCAYAGVCSHNARERINRYRQSIRGIDAFDEDDIFIAILPCASTASARFCEAALIESLDPVWNGLGFGAKVPGSTRSRQQISPIDALFPRRWAPSASLVDTARAQLQVLSNLTRRDPNGPRWPALVPTRELGRARLRLVLPGGDNAGSAPC